MLRHAVRKARWQFAALEIPHPRCLKAQPGTSKPKVSLSPTLFKQQCVTVLWEAGGISSKSRMCIKTCFQCMHVSSLSDKRHRSRRNSMNTCGDYHCIIVSVMLSQNVLAYSHPHPARHRNHHDNHHHHYDHHHLYYHESRSIFLRSTSS